MPPASQNKFGNGYEMNEPTTDKAYAIAMEIFLLKLQYMCKYICGTPRKKIASFFPRKVTNDTKVYQIKLTGSFHPRNRISKEVFRYFRVQP